MQLMASLDQPRRRAGAGLSLFALFLATASIAQALEKQQPTGPQQQVQKLRDAAGAQTEPGKSAEQQRLASRWESLVRQRQWTDSSGKFKTFAAYLDHDPQLEWVELRVVVKQKNKVSYKDVKVPLTKLDKAARDVLNRIVIARPLVEKSLADSPDSATGLAAQSPSEADAFAAADNPQAAEPFASQPVADANLGVRPPAEQPADPNANESPAAEEAPYVGDTRSAAQSLVDRIGAQQSRSVPEVDREQPAAETSVPAPAGDDMPINVPSDAYRPATATAAVQPSPSESPAAASPSSGASIADVGAAWSAAREQLLARLNSTVADPAVRAVADKFATDVSATLAPLEGVQCVLTFQVADGAFDSLYAQHSQQLLKQGWYLFRLDRSYGIGGGLDTIALLPTTDKYEVLTVVQTNGANYDLSPWDVIDRLKKIGSAQPFAISEAGFDYCAGNFLSSIKDPKQLADELYKFCPDIVDQGVGDVETLEKELSQPTPKLYLWWD